MPQEDGYLCHTHRGIWFEVYKKSLPTDVSELIREGKLFAFRNYFSISTPMKESDENGSYIFRIEFRGDSEDNLKFSINTKSLTSDNYQILTEETEWQHIDSCKPENVSPVILGVSKHCICKNPKNCQYCKNSPDQEVFIINCIDSSEFELTKIN